ncbi:uncharacterized protein [Palaemon carinicauda]|uniref:uncharacterized protein n=1 Tax=Palaemon carinicauda TaxID=392227 RepID=UPI0035B5EF35
MAVHLLYPQTSNGFYIWPRTYTIHLRGVRDALLPAVKIFPSTLITLREFLQEWSPQVKLKLDKLKSMIQFHNKEKQSVEKHTSLITNLRKIQKRPPNEENMAWIENMFKRNKIDIEEFLAWVILIADRKLNKINTLVLQGPTGTGKSLTLNAILSKFNTGIVTRNGDANQFHLQNLLGKTFALFEEPRISQITVDDYKLLFEGADFEINVKHQEPEILTRIPVFVSTNKELDYWVPPR